jgi:hypothetical protein
MRDNPTDEQPGWNFLKDHRTHMPAEGERWLFERVGRNTRTQDRFMKLETCSGIDWEAVEQYIGRIVEFREKLAVLMHIAGGQPARGPEILSVQHSNTIKGGHCNIFIKDSIVVFITQYYKRYNVSSDVKIIY